MYSHNILEHTVCPGFLLQNVQTYRPFSQTKFLLEAEKKCNGVQKAPTSSPVYSLFTLPFVQKAQTSSSVHSLFTLNLVQKAWDQFICSQPDLFTLHFVQKAQTSSFVYSLFTLHFVQKAQSRPVHLFTAWPVHSSFCPKGKDQFICKPSCYTQKPRWQLTPSLPCIHERLNAGQ